tara:strand:- start:1561 stop:2049 length:489 start_codon:yes stop_codon:yes gene_type:complete
MAGRFIRSRDIEFFDTVNKELVGDPKTSKDGVINQIIHLYKVDAYETETNLYGETAGGGKAWSKGIKLACTIEATDFDFEATEFGPDLNQDATFSFLRQSLIDSNVIVDIGDYIEWNYAYWEISAVNENQLVGGQFDRNHSVVATAYLTEVTRLNIERTRAI